MKKLLLAAFAAFALLACNDQKAEAPIQSILQPDTVQSENTKTVKVRNGSPALTDIERSKLASILKDFNKCKAEARTRSDCRNGITKALVNWYDLDEFSSNGTIVYHDSIRPIIARNSSWEHLGTGKDQSAMELAQENANKGIPTLAIDQSQPYGSVVMIIPGTTKMAGKWEGMKVPNCLHLTHVKTLTPFMDKSAAYAFKTGDQIHFYSKTGK